MDTYISITAYGDNADTAVKNAEEEIQRLEKLWSVTDGQSEIFSVNHSGETSVTVSNDAADVVRFALGTAEKTDGAFDPTIYPVLSLWGFTTGENSVPSAKEIEEQLRFVGYGNVRLDGNKIMLPDGFMLDLGAVGKGYASDIAAEMIRKCGVSSALLDIGGSVLLIGSKPDGSKWRLAVRDPFGGDNIGILELSDCAVASSGTYERYFEENGVRYGHIIDPTTGYPAETDLASVTIISKEGRLSDALSTSMFVMGAEKAADYWREYRDFDMLLVTADGKIYLTEGIKDSFVPNSSYGNDEINVIY
ncbi:MAG: FAD:protein FMN transferase [Huintestinicola sp.]